ncbi:hypothetical protein DPH57_00510 [Massilia sp. YMA4]|nr:hypothetical protein DPH57_00510 [Massilia sp. YMA4]
MLLSGAACASSSSVTTRLSDLNISVFDLTPDDGIQSTFAITDSSTTISAYVGNGTQQWLQELSPSAAATVDAAGLASASQAAWGGKFGGFDLTSNSASNGTMASTYVTQRITLTLAPHTGLVAEGWLSMTGHQATAQSTWVQEVYIDLMPSNSAGYGEYRFKKRATSWPTGEFDSNQPITMSFVNTSDVARNVYFSLNGHTFVNTVGLVPEPSTYAMLGAGLLALGLHARRRRTR